LILSLLFLVEDESLPIGKQWRSGGSLHDFFFDAAPRWTVGNALNRILTKVKNNPESSVHFLVIERDGLDCRILIHNF